jgi:hypothetical protein
VAGVLEGPPQVIPGPWITPGPAAARMPGNLYASWQRPESLLSAGPRRRSVPLPAGVLPHPEPSVFLPSSVTSGLR